MKGLLTGLVAGVAVGSAAAALAVPTWKTAAPAPTCKRTTLSRTQYTCTLPHMRAGAYAAYTVRIPDLDVTCLLSPADASQNLPESFGCSRASTSLKCVDGIFDSLSVALSVRRVEIDEPQTCRLKPSPPGYKLTSGYTPHVFYRNP